MAVHLEPSFGPIFDHDRGERAERFAELCLQVERFLHVGVTGVGDDAPSPQCTRPEFHPPLEPSDDVPLGDQRGGTVTKRQVVERFELRPDVAERAADRLVIESGAEPVVERRSGRWLGRPDVSFTVDFKIEFAVEFAMEFTIEFECDPEGAAGVPRGGLDPDAIEDAFAEESPVGRTVQRHAAGHAEVFVSGQLAGVPGDPQHDRLGDRLDRRRQVTVELADRRRGVSRSGVEQLAEPIGQHRVASGEVE